MRRFKAHEIYTPWRSTVSVRHDLRLLPQPILRYKDPGAGILDGAIFLLAHEGNPEIIVVIEARREGSAEPVWTPWIPRETLRRRFSREPR